MAEKSLGNVLIVEDEPIDRALLAASLEANYSVQFAQNGRQALEMLHQQPFDVVLLDLLMPEMDGFQVLEQIKNSPLRHLPVIVISAMDDMANSIRCIEMGAADYLPKPFDPVLLHARLNASLSNKRLYDLEQASLRQLEEERSRLQALIASSRDGLMMIAQDGHVRVLNIPAFQLLHLRGTPDQYLDRSYVCILQEIRHSYPRLVRQLIGDIRRFLVLPDESNGEFELGGRFVRWSNLPVMAENAPLGRLVVLRDVTEERQLERMRQDLTHTLVHDLRNPLANIRTSLDLLLSDQAPPVTPHQRELLNVSRSCSNRMLDLVNAILDISHLESGQVPINRQYVSLKDLVLDAMLLQLPQAQEKGLTLAEDLPEKLPSIWVDPGLLRRVFQNLIGNAVKFTPQGGVVRIKVERANDHLLVAISDDGPGVLPEIRESLFQKFVTGRVDGSGNGLGLAFCRLVIEAHGGRIWLDTKVERGSTFCFTLPTAHYQPESMARSQD